MKIATHIFGPFNFKIILKARAGTSPDSSALADLRTIARTCLADGGRAVLGARGLCSTWLKEHYSDDNCQTAPQGRSAKPEPEAGGVIGNLLIVPNPAQDLVQLRMEESRPGQDVSVQISSLDGRQMYRGAWSPGNTGLSVHVGTWPQGLYLVRVFDGHRVLARTFVVVH